jgi:uncharacterized protein (TIGR02594 family)
MTLPAQFRFLADEPGPKILREALKTYGTIEVPGPGDNQEILRWARVCDLGTVYQHDATAWCGLAVAYWATMAGFTPPDNPLWALNWKKFGTTVLPTAASLGDILVFRRKTPAGWAGHVGLYVGHAMKGDALHYAVLGGNQSDQVNISWLPATRLVAVRRCPWKRSQPQNVRPIRLGAAGPVSTSEA